MALFAPTPHWLSISSGIKSKVMYVNCVQCPIILASHYLSDNLNHSFSLQICFHCILGVPPTCQTLSHPEGISLVVPSTWNSHPPNICLAHSLIFNFCPNVTLSIKHILTIILPLLFLFYISSYKLSSNVLYNLLYIFLYV